MGVGKPSTPRIDVETAPHNSHSTFFESLERCPLLCDKACVRVLRVPELNAE